VVGAWSIADTEGEEDVGEREGIASRFLAFCGPERSGSSSSSEPGSAGARAGAYWQEEALDRVRPTPGRIAEGDVRCHSGTYSEVLRWAVHRLSLEAEEVSISLWAGTFPEVNVQARDERFPFASESRLTVAADVGPQEDGEDCFSARIAGRSPGVAGAGEAVMEGQAETDPEDAAPAHADVPTAGEARGHQAGSGRQQSCRTTGRGSRDGTN